MIRWPVLAQRLWDLISNRWPTIISIFGIVPIGFYSKFYRGSAAQWVNGSLGGVFYEIFW